MKSPLAALDARLIGTRSTGDASYWRGLVSGFSKLKGDFHLLLCSNTEKPPEIPDDPRIEWVVLPGRGRWWSFVTLPLYAKKRGCPVLHTQYSLSPLAQGGVTTVHDVSFFVGPEWFKPKDRFLLQKSVPSSVRRAKAVIAVSETTKREIEQFIPGSAHKVHVTYNSVGEGIQPHPLDAARRMVKEAGIEGPYMMTAGTRWPRKNMELAMAAADLLPESLSHKLVVTGKPGWGDQSHGKRTHATGYVSDELLTALYQCADLYLCPSRHEGFGIPLLEAFACSCPVICSSGGALPEVAQDACLVMKSWEAADWAEAAAGLLNDPTERERLVAKGAIRLGDFSWEATAAKTLDIYRTVATEAAVRK